MAEDPEKKRRSRRESARRRRQDPAYRAAVAAKMRERRADPIIGARIKELKRLSYERNREHIREQARLRRQSDTFKQARKTWAERHPQSAILAKVRSRARHAGIPFALSKEHIIIPEICPVLGIPLVLGGRTDGSISVDRRDNKKGYVPGNVFIISMRANRIKSDSTVEDLEALIRYMRG